MAGCGNSSEADNTPCGAAPEAFGATPKPSQIEAARELAGAAGHDLRNQITVVRAHAEMLLCRGLLADGGRQHVEEILGAMEGLTGIARELLAFSHGQPTKVPDGPAAL